MHLRNVIIYLIGIPVLDAREPGDKAWYRRVEHAAKKRKACFVPVWLTCDAEVIRKRKDSLERRARLKDIDLTNIDRWFKEFKTLTLPHPNALTLDTSRSTPQAVAKRIIEHVNQLKRE